MRTYPKRAWATPGQLLLLLSACETGTIDIVTPPPSTDDEPFPSAIDFEWRGRLEPGNVLEVKGLQGEIEVTQSVGSEAVIRAEKRGTMDDPRLVRVEVVQHAGGLTVCAVYPDTPGNPPNECRPGEGGFLNVNNNDVEVRFRISLPAGADFVGKSVAGSVRAIDLAGDVSVSSVAGNIDISADGFAEASTVSGSIEVRLGATRWGRDLRFATVTGNVSVRVPAATNALVEANVGHGRFNSDFPLSETAVGRWEGTLGDGGRTLELSSLNGDVTLRRGF